MPPGGRCGATAQAQHVARAMWRRHSDEEVWYSSRYLAVRRYSFWPPGGTTIVLPGSGAALSRGTTILPSLYPANAAELDRLPARRYRNTICSSFTSVRSRSPAIPLRFTARCPASSGTTTMILALHEPVTLTVTSRATHDLAGDSAGAGRRTGRGSGRCGGTAGPRSGRHGRRGVGPFARVPPDLGYGREARRSSIWRASPRLAWRGDPRENGGALDGVRVLPAKAKARRSHPLPLLTYSRLGGLRQDPGRAAESAAGPRTDEDMGARRACVVVGIRGTR